METFQTKRRILGDVALGVAHLHYHRIDERISGKAKLCDLDVSRYVEDTLNATMDAFTRPAGTALYMSPESFSNSA